MRAAMRPFAWWLLLACVIIIGAVVNAATPSGPVRSDSTPTNGHGWRRTLLELQQQDISTTGACQIEIQDYCGLVLQASQANRHAHSAGQGGTKQQPAQSQTGAQSVKSHNKDTGTSVAQGTPTPQQGAGSTKHAAAGSTTPSNSKATSGATAPAAKAATAGGTPTSTTATPTAQAAQAAASNATANAAGTPGQGRRRTLLAAHPSRVVHAAVLGPDVDWQLGLQQPQQQAYQGSAQQGSNTQQGAPLAPLGRQLQSRQQGLGKGPRKAQKKVANIVSGTAVAVLKELGIEGVHEGQQLPPPAPVARCLRRVVRLSETSVSPDSPQVSEACVEELHSFLVKRATEVQQQLDLWVACAVDVQQRCSSFLKPAATAAQLLGCLKGHKQTLQLNCKQAVTQQMIDSAEDISLDPELHAACSADRGQLCPDAGWGQGGAKQCLEHYLMRKEEPQLSGPCQNALLARMMQDAENMRFDYHLAAACASDKQKLCTDVSADDGAAFECLVAELHSMDLTAPCQSALEHATVRRSLDVRLHWQFRKACSPEVRRLCSQEELLLLHDTTGPLGKAGPVFECMRQQVRNITQPACGQLVHNMLVAGFTDNRLDPLFQQACSEEARRLCSTQPNQVVCLQERVQEGQQLSAQCARLVSNRLQQAASDIDYNPLLRDKCMLERTKFCDYADVTGGAVIDCLVDYRQVSGFGAVCREALGKYLVAAMSDIRMLHTLREACAEDMQSLCFGVQPGQGQLLLCLQQKRGHIQSGGCKMQLLRVAGLQAEDHRLHHHLNKMCASDMQQFCSDVPEGGGLMHKCLRVHESKLSPECRKLEEELEAAEHEDVRINPTIRRTCNVAVTLFCSDLEPGNARVLTCLRGNMDKADFPADCKKALKEQLNRASMKLSLNKPLQEACANEECPAEKLEDADNSRMKCLAERVSGLSEDCRSKLLAQVKLQLSHYRMGMPLTAPCDGDVLSHCHIDKLNMPLLARGYVLQCLVRHADQLHKPCWELVSAFDEGEREHAQELEKRHWNQQLQQGQIDKVVAEVRSKLEPRLTQNMMQQLGGLVRQQQELLRPKLRGILLALGLLSVGCAYLLYVLLRWRKTRGPLVLKDGTA